MSDDELREHGGEGAVRIARLGERLDSMERESTHWRQEISNALTQLSGQISSIASKVSDSRSANYPLLISFIMMLIVIGSLVLYPLNARLVDEKHRLEKLDAEFRSHASMKLHPVGEREVESINTRLNDRADINAQLITRLEQKEIAENSRIQQTLDAEISSLRREFEDVKQFGSQHTRDRLTQLEEWRKVLERPKP